MTIKSDIWPSVNSTMLTVCAAGRAWVQSNKALITSSILSNIQQGFKSFTIKLPVSFEPNNLRKNNYHLKAFLSGVTTELVVEEIMSYECVPSLNTDDQVDLLINLAFSF